MKTAREWAGGAWVKLRIGMSAEDAELTVRRLEDVFAQAQDEARAAAIEECIKVLKTRASTQWLQARIHEDNEEEAGAYEHAGMMLENAAKELRELTAKVPGS